MTPGELAEHEKVQPPSMTRVIAALEESRLVTRAAARLRPAPGGADRDAGRPGPGDAGHAGAGTHGWRRRLNELTPQERATLRAAAPILEKLSQS